MKKIILLITMFTLTFAFKVCGQFTNGVTLIYILQDGQKLEGKFNLDSKGNLDMTMVSKMTVNGGDYKLPGVTEISVSLISGFKNLLKTKYKSIEEFNKSDITNQLRALAKKGNSIKITIKYEFGNPEDKILFVQ